MTILLVMSYKFSSENHKSLEEKDKIGIGLSE